MATTSMNSSDVNGQGAVGSVLTSQGGGGPNNWTTATYPSSTTINQLLFSSANNTITGLSTANNGMVVTSSTGVPSVLAGPGATGKVLQSNAAAAPSFSTATFPSTATSTGTILRADGTNWSATTATYPNTTTINQILFSNAANTITGLATANGGVLDTTSTGVPQVDTTNFSVLSTGVQVKGNNTNTAPPAGFIGERINSFQASGISITSTQAKTITSINLTAGIWDISAVGQVSGASTTNMTVCQFSISNTNNALGASGLGDDTTGFNVPAGFVTASLGYSIPGIRVLLSGSATYYLVVQATFTVSTATALGRISAVRVG